MAADPSWIQALELYTAGLRIDPTHQPDTRLAGLTPSRPETHSSMYSAFTDALTHDISAHPLPPIDLVDSLVDLFFERFHSLSPILHRPSFERAIQTGEYKTDMAFKSVVFGVLALGSHFSQDRRVLQDFGYLPRDCLLKRQFGRLRTEEERRVSEDQSYIPLEECHSMSWTSAGWAFAWVVSCAQTPLFSTSTLADLQASFLLCHHVVVTVGLEQAWTLSGFYIRRAQDLGLHRRGSARPDASFMEQESVSWASCFVLSLLTTRVCP